MDAKIANNFIENISKHIQLLLRHYIPFEHQVEVMGHLNINVDLNTKVNYIVSEKCEKENASDFNTISTSFHITPDPTSSISTHTPCKDEKLQTPLPTLPTLSFKRPSSTPVRRSPIKRVKIRCIPQDSTEESPSTSAEESRSTSAELSQEEEEERIKDSEDANGSIIVSVNESDNEEEEVEDDSESFMSEPDMPPSEERFPDDGVEYTIIEYGTQMGKPLLVDNIGYSYNLRKATELDKEKVIWRCTKRNKNLRCTASVYQRGDNFTTGTRPHEHPPQRGMLTSALIYAEVKHSGANDSQVPNSGVWRCSKRNKKLLCPASIYQNGETFTTGSRLHIHEPQKGLLTSALIYAEIRNQAMTDFQTPAAKIVARALSVGGSNEEEGNLPKEANLRRLLSRYRCRERKRLTESVKEEDHEYMTIVVHDPE